MTLFSELQESKKYAYAAEEGQSIMRLVTGSYPPNLPYRAMWLEALQRVTPNHEKLFQDDLDVLRCIVDSAADGKPEHDFMARPPRCSDWLSIDDLEWLDEGLTLYAELRRHLAEHEDDGGVCLADLCMPEAFANRILDWLRTCTRDRYARLTRCDCVLPWIANAPATFPWDIIDLVWIDGQECFALLSLTAAMAWWRMSPHPDNAYRRYFEVAQLGPDQHHILGVGDLSAYSTAFFRMWSLVADRFCLDVAPAATGDNQELYRFFGAHAGCRLIDLTHDDLPAWLRRPQKARAGNKRLLGCYENAFSPPRPSFVRMWCDLQAVAADPGQIPQRRNDLASSPWMIGANLDQVLCSLTGLTVAERSQQRALQREERGVYRGPIFSASSITIAPVQRRMSIVPNISALQTWLDSCPRRFEVGYIRYATAIQQNDAPGARLDSVTHGRIGNWGDPGEIQLPLQPHLQVQVQAFTGQHELIASHECAFLGWDPEQDVVAIDKDGQLRDSLPQDGRPLSLISSQEISVDHIDRSGNVLTWKDSGYGWGIARIAADHTWAYADQLLPSTGVDADVPPFSVAWHTRPQRIGEPAELVLIADRGIRLCSVRFAGMELSVCANNDGWIASLPAIPPRSHDHWLTKVYLRWQNAAGASGHGWLEIDPDSTALIGCRYQGINGWQSLASQTYVLLRRCDLGRSLQAIVIGQAAEYASWQWSFGGGVVNTRPARESLTLGQLPGRGEMLTLVGGNGLEYPVANSTIRRGWIHTVKHGPTRDVISCVVPPEQFAEHTITVERLIAGQITQIEIERSLITEIMIEGNPASSFSIPGTDDELPPLIGLRVGDEPVGCWVDDGGCAWQQLKPHVQGLSVQHLVIPQLEFLLQYSFPVFTVQAMSAIKPIVRVGYPYALPWLLTHLEHQEAKPKHEHRAWDFDVESCRVLTWWLCDEQEQWLKSIIDQNPMNEHSQDFWQGLWRLNPLCFLRCARLAQQEPWARSLIADLLGDSTVADLQQGTQEDLRHIDGNEIGIFLDHARSCLDNPVQSQDPAIRTALLNAFTSPNFRLLTSSLALHQYQE